MLQKEKRKRLFIHFLVLILLISASLLSACTSQQNAKPKANEVNEKQNNKPSPTKDWKLPIAIPEGEFYKVGGWVSDHQLLYITNAEQTSTIYLYDLLTGKSKKIYKSEVPIVTTQVSPQEKYILVHTSPSTYEGRVTIISSEGSELLEHSFASYELSFEWNPYNESEVLVSSFNNDWTYQMELIDIEKRTTTELSLSQPFIKWLNEEEIAYLQWDDNQPALTAPLLVQNLKTNEVKTLFPEVLQFSANQESLMTITVPNQDQGELIYSFLNQELKPLFSFSVPHLTMFSGWLVPFFDMNENGKFISLEPVKSAEADTYSDGFQLAVYDTEKGSQQMIMNGLMNEPVLLAPSGNATLYGNKFEKIIDFSSKKIYDLVKE
ncbi:YqgU-like beta propeller domain-containing protein [Neobacillus sp. K501]